MSSEIEHFNPSGDQLDLLKRTIALGTSDDEFALFAATCKRSGLDPFQKQIHAVMRWNGKAGREVMTIQVGIDGLRLIGHRTGQVDGVEGPFWCGADGEWRDVWLDPNPPLAAKFTVFRKGATRGYAGTAHYSEYCQSGKDGKPSSMWQSRPVGQLAKCAEALAWRMAFPAEMSGLYSTDEMGQAANADHSSQCALPASPRDAIREAIAAIDGPQPQNEPNSASTASESLADDSDIVDAEILELPNTPNEWIAFAKRHGVKLADLKPAGIISWGEPAKLSAGAQTDLVNFIVTFTAQTGAEDQ